MKNLRKAFANMATKYKPKCDPIPGKWNSCEPCKNCGRRAKYPESGGEPPIPCCIIDPPLVFNQDYLDNGVMFSTIITINVTCPTRLYFTAYQLDGVVGDQVLYITLNGISDTQLSEGNPTPIDVNNGDTLQFKLQVLGKGGCWECYVYNETCNIPNTICINPICVS